MGTTPIPGPRSFTSALIFALKALLEEKGRFTTVELIGKIKGAPNFPKDQYPMLLNRSSNTLADRIILSPLHRNKTDGSQSIVLAEEDKILDAYKSRVLTLHFDFGSQPSYTAIESIGRQLNQVFERRNLDVNQVRWGGVRESATARAVEAFRATRKRSRCLSMMQQQATSDSTDPQSIRISPSKLFPIKGSKSSTTPETSYPGSSTSSKELSTSSGEISSATPLSMVDQWEEFDQPKLEQQQEQMAVRDILIKRIADTSILGKTLETRLINVAYRCSWELLRVLQDEYEPNQPLSGIVTLTGTLECAQAATCGEYIPQTWPNAGSFLLQAIGNTLKVAQETPLEYDLPPCKPARGSVAGFEEIQLCVEKAPLAAGKTIRPIILRVKGSMSFQVEVAEILAWLTAAIRLSESTELRLSRARLLFTQYSRDTDQFSFCIEPETLQNPQRNANFCWQPLFVNSVIAVQFPVRERFQGVGVDISPMLMATLAGTVTAVQFRGGLILKGLSTALIPVRRLRGEQAIQWHLEVTDSTEGIIQTRGLEPTATNGDEFEIYRVDNVETFWESRAYLGWCSVIAILLGTKKINYSRVTWSDSFRHQMTININSFSIGLASAGGGFGGPNVSANFAIGKRNRPVFMNVEQALEDRLKFSILKPLLSYDTLSKRAWMVPTTCMLLHMMHLRVRLLANCVGHSKQESIAEMPFASITQDGGSEAYGILVKYLRTEEVSPLGSSETWKETLAKFYVGLDMALNESIIAKEKASFASSHELCGFELMDIVRAESPFKFTQRQIRRESGGWTTAAESLGYALFCSGLGDAMVPGEGANDLCRSWQHVPHNSDYLCAYVPCIAEILTHQGKHTGHQRLMANEFQQSHYKSCSHEENSRCSSHLRTFEEVSDPPRVVESRDGLVVTDANASGSIIPSGGNRGAFIIGKITKVTKAFPRDDPSDGGDERVYRFGGFWRGTKRKRNRSA